jgi:branched-chain amino acid transport system ATP-binding protein
MTLLRAEGLGKRFGGLRAVDGVDLSVEQGEIVGVIGPNGAGKTTLFSLLAGSLPPSSGRVLLGGAQISGRPAWRAVRAGIARTHQIVRPFHGLTVLDNVLVAAQNGAGPRGARGGVRERALEALRLVGLDDRKDQLPSALTLAARKRLELARALATLPRVLLLDEVIAGVTPSEAQEMTALIRRVRDARGLSLLVIEHVMPALMSLSQRVVVLDAGRKIFEGTPAQVARDPGVIAAYLGRSAAEHAPPAGDAP